MSEAEQHVIGCCVQNSYLVDTVIDVLKPEDFYVEIHGRFYKRIVELFEKNKPVDLLTVGEGMANEDLAYLGQLVADVYSTANVKYHAYKVRDEAVERKLRLSLVEISQILDESGDTAEKLDKAQGIINGISEEVSTGSASTAKTILANVIDDISERHENGGEISGISTGLVDLDKILCGLHGGDLIIVAGRPSMGKTALANRIAVSVAEKHNVHEFSMEMGKKSLMEREIASIGKIDFNHIRNGQLEDDEWSRLTMATAKLAESGLVIDDTPGLSINQIRARARRAHRKSPLSLIVIDYIQLMGGSKGENRTQEVSAMSRGLKSLARELDIPVIALSQLNRSVEQRQDKHPIMADLRESGAIEQDADVIIFVYRDEVYNEGTPNPGVAEIVIAKQRQGEKGTVYLTFQGKYVRFDNYAGQFIKPIAQVVKGGFDYAKVGN